MTDGYDVDNSNEMAVTFDVIIDTNRAAQTLKTVEDAINKIVMIGAKTGTRSKRITPLAPNSFVNALELDIQGRVEGKVVSILSYGMRLGTELTQIGLENAVTVGGEIRYSRGRGHGPGRDDTQTMKKGVKWNVSKTVSASPTNTGRVLNSYRRRAVASGWFGWDNPQEYFEEQEKGTKWGRGRGIPPAHSLGYAMIVAREQILDMLGDL